jgi:hypothetical protein
MAKVRYTGKGGLVKVASGNSFVAVGLCTNVTPPPMERAVIDVTGMEDTTAVAASGIEQLSSMDFECLHDPEDTTDDLVETLYGSGNTATWQIVTASGAKTWTKSFSGVVTSIVPNGFGGNDAVKRKVTVQRAGVVTDTVA